MNNTQADFKNSKSAKPESRKPFLTLLGPTSPQKAKKTPAPQRKEPGPRAANTAASLASMDFSIPPWLLPENEGLLDDEGFIALLNLTTLISIWLQDCKHRKKLSPKTLDSYEESTRYLLWFIEHRNASGCDETMLYQFFEYCEHGHTMGVGRWGVPGNTEPLSERSQNLHYANLRAMFRWAAKNKRLSHSIIERVPVPKFKPATVQPFSETDVGKLLESATKTRQPLRDVAILLFTWDTGIREAELCSLKMEDFKIEEQTTKIRHGKGDKERTVIFGNDTAAAMWNYLRTERRAKLDPLFPSRRTKDGLKPLTESGLYQLFQRLGEAAGLEGVRCSPHTMRHAFASHALMNGALPDEVRRQLGHTSLAMTQKYVELTDDFKRERHNTSSPVTNFLSEQPVIKRRGRPRKR